MWKYTGSERPPFASPPQLGQLSVWDFPRPPALLPYPRRVVVRARAVTLADSDRAVRIVETASPPTCYLPPDAVRLDLLREAAGSSCCEWKGIAAYLALAPVDGIAGEVVAWRYPNPRPAFAWIAGWIAFYPGRVECEVDGERVRPQPGGFYGGWLTDEIVGPVKGEPGTGHW